MAQSAPTTEPPRIAPALYAKTCFFRVMLFVRGSRRALPIASIRWDGADIIVRAAVRDEADSKPLDQRFREADGVFEVEVVGEGGRVLRVYAIRVRGEIKPAAFESLDAAELGAVVEVVRLCDAVVMRPPTSAEA